jgi:hypothetical protein
MRVHGSCIALGLLLASAAALSPAAAQQYVISTVAGGAPPPIPIAADASIGHPFGVATDSAGNVYLCVWRAEAGTDLKLGFAQRWPRMRARVPLCAISRPSDNTRRPFPL